MPVDTPPTRESPSVRRDAGAEHAPPARPPAARWLPGALFYLLLLIAFVLYAPGLSGPVLLDDYHNLEPLIAMESGALDWQEVLTVRAAGIRGRPLSMLTFIANWLTTGGDVAALKYTNLMIHLLCGTLVFWLAGRVLAEPRAACAERRWWLALCVCALWLLAPIMVSTVLYIVQRMAQLSTLFVLAGLVCYVIARQRLEKRRRDGLLLLGACFLVFWPMAILSKQNGALLPLLALVIELFFFERPAARRDRRLLHGLLAVTVGLPAVALVLKLALDPAWITAEYAIRDFSLYQRLLTEPRIVLDYVANTLLIPGGTPLGLYHDDFEISRGLLDPPSTIVAIAAIAATLAAGWRLRGTRTGLLLFGPVFFLAGHAIESTFIPLELYFEHRNYLPSVGLFISLAVALDWVRERVRSRALVLVVFAAVPLGFAVSSAFRVIVWQSEETLLLAAAETHPRSPRVHTGLASHYINLGDIERGIEHLDLADEFYGGRRGYAIALHRLAAFCFADREPSERLYAALENQSGVIDDIYTSNALKWLSESAERGECANLDLARIAAVLHRDTLARKGPGEHNRNWALQLHTARLLALVGRKREAIGHLRAAGELREGWLEPGLLAVRYQLDIGDVEGARRTLAELKRRDRGRLALHSRLIEELERRLR